MRNDRADHVRDHVNMIARSRRPHRVRVMILDAYRVGYLDGATAAGRADEIRPTTRELIDGVREFADFAEVTYKRLGGRIEP